MPTVLGKVMNAYVEGGAFLCLIRLNRKLPQKNENVTLKWGSKRTLPQNSLYWVFLTWLINDAGLKDQGHFSPEALHLDLKTHILAEKIFDRGKFKAIEEATTTTLNKVEFSDYLERVNLIVWEIFGVDTNPFWEMHKENYAP